MDKSSISDEAKKYLEKTITKYKTLTGKFKKMIGVGVLAYTAAIGTNMLVGEDPVTVGIVADRADDGYVNSVPVYDSKEEKKLITTINDGSLIVIKDNVKNDSGDRYVSISCVDKKNRKQNGYIPEKYLKRSVRIDSDYSLTRVDDRKPIDIREKPKYESDKIASSIPSGTIVMSKKKDNIWSNVVYIGKNDLIEGYAISQYLKPIDKEIKKSNERKDIKKAKVAPPSVKKELISDIKYTAHNGKVFGIDICELPPQMLENLLTGKLPIKSLLYDKDGRKQDMSKYPDRIPRFVYLKLAGSGYRSENLKQGAPVQFKKLAEVCEKLGVPYGFYYYSTCVNDKEAEQEYKWISEHLSTLPKGKYNLMPFVLDVEYANERDRQSREKNRKQVTDAKIKLANLLERDNGKTILYTAMNTLEDFLDIEQYQEGLTKGKSGVWLVKPSNRFLNLPHIKREHEKVESQIIATQVKLDSQVSEPKMKLESKEYVREVYKKVKGKRIKVKEVVPAVYKVSRFYLADMDEFDEEMFKKCISGQYRGDIMDEYIEKKSKLIAKSER